MQAAVFTVFLVVLASSAWADVITLRADEWCPYNCQPNSQNPGFIIEIAEAVFKKAGHTIDYQVMPWARAIEDTKKGKFNGIVGSGRDDAPGFIFPETEQGQMLGSFYVKKGESWQFSGVASLKDKTLGVIKDYTYRNDINAYITEHEKDSKLIQMASGDAPLDINVKKLLAGRIQVLLEDVNVMSLYLKENSQQNVLQIAGQLTPDNIYIAFAPENPKSADYAKILSEGIVELRKNGTLKTILEKYGLSDWR